LPERKDEEGGRMKLNQNYRQSRQKEGGGKVEACRGEGSKRTGGHGEERGGEKL
jgi:hypothetical protein